MRFSAAPQANTIIRRLVCLLMVLLAPSANAAPQSEEVELKAAFIYNFVLFTSWPQPLRSLNICVLGQDSYTSALGKYEGRKVMDAPVRVRQIHTADETRSCDVLFVSHAEPELAEQAYKACEGLPVLTVAESDMTDSSAMIVLVRDNNRVVFEISQNAATGARLALSSKLLKLARKIR